MKRKFWLSVVDLTGRNRVSWYIEHSEDGWSLSSDAVSHSQVWLEPFETTHGCYEMVALFLTKEQYEQGKEVMQRFSKKLSADSAAGEANKKPGESLTDIQRQLLLLYEMGKTEDEIASAVSMSIKGVKQLSYRCRKHFNFSKTAELLKFLRSQNFLSLLFVVQSLQL